jgi:hypothetical protein
LYWAGLHKEDKKILRQGAMLLMQKAASLAAAAAAAGDTASSIWESDKVLSQSLLMVV